MIFPQAILDEIKARLTVSSVVGRRVRFDPKRSTPAIGDYWACCPFHEEHTPSFHADDRRGRYKCFGCGESGDIFRFVMDTERVEFPDAVERLARDAGVSLPKESPEAEARLRALDRLRAANDLARRYYADELARPHGETALAYLERRGVGASARERFGIGFAPSDQSRLLAAGRAAGLTDKDFIAAGLFARDEERGSLYPRFRGRIMFPISDARGRIIAFGGRVLPGAPDKLAKYINSPETDLFRKRETLYGLAEARSLYLDARGETKPPILVVEGYLDVIALIEAGLPAVAPLGTATGEPHLRALWKLVPEPVLCFDGDAGGERGLAKAIDVALPLVAPERTLKICRMPPGQDPDDVVRAGGVAAVQALLANAQALADVCFDMELKREPLATPEAEAGFEARLDALAKRIEIEAVAWRYRSHFRARMRTLRSERFAARGAGKRGRLAEADPLAGLAPSQTSAANPGELTEELILAGCLAYPGLIDGAGERLALLRFRSAELEGLKAATLDFAATADLLDRDALRAHLCARGFDKMVGRLLDYGRSRAHPYLSKAAGLDEAESAMLGLLDRYVSIDQGRAEKRELEQTFKTTMSLETWERLREARLANERTRTDL